MELDGIRWNLMFAGTKWAQFEKGERNTTIEFELKGQVHMIVH